MSVSTSPSVIDVTSYKNSTEPTLANKRKVSGVARLVVRLTVNDTNPSASVSAVLLESKLTPSAVTAKLFKGCPFLSITLTVIQACSSIGRSTFHQLKWVTCALANNTPSTSVMFALSMVLVDGSASSLNQVP